MATDVLIPALGESVTEASVGQWLKQVGDRVAADEPIVSLETDKVAVEVPAPVAGVLAEQLAKVGDTVEVGALIARIAEADGAAKARDAAETAPPAPAGAEAPAADGEPRLAPAAERLIAQYALDPVSISGSGKGGQVTKADVLAAIEAGTARLRADGVRPAEAGPAAPAAAAPAAGARTEERVRMSRLRQTIAKRLKEAQNTAAMLTTFNDVDMTAVMEARARYRDLFERKHGVRLGFMSFFVKACVLAARDVPAVNARIDGDEIVFHDYMDVGVAVSGPSGLVVPVLRDADRLGFAAIETAIADFGARARDGTLRLEELQGGTFTISNGGVFGSLLSTPILNPPQSGVLGMHRIEERPVARNGQVVIRPMMYLALSYDHRLIDGREAVTFLVRVKEALEDPTRLLVDL